MAPVEAKAKSSSKDKEKKEKTDKVGAVTVPGSALQSSVPACSLGKSCTWLLPSGCGGASLVPVLLRVAALAIMRLASCLCGLTEETRDMCWLKAPPTNLPRRHLHGRLAIIPSAMRMAGPFTYSKRAFE